MQIRSLVSTCFRAPTRRPLLTRCGIWCFRAPQTLFTQVLNPMIGLNEWRPHNEDSDDYDYHQEVANAGFGDMLHDTERNRKYYAAIRKTIAAMHAEGRKVNALDIGTGTGILAMMAVVAGADSMYACEAFLPMANCAERILATNGMADRVHLVKKRSTDLRIGEDLPKRANLLISEVLDTELIGEGAISIYNHAHDELLTEDAVCIPARATCFAQVVQSQLAAQWNTLKLVVNLDGETLLKPPSEMSQCRGEAGLHDLQLSQLPIEQFRPITKPIEIFEFDFSRKKRRDLKRERNMTVESSCPGTTDLVFYWWEIKMDAEGEILLSCAPFWTHPDFGQLAANKEATHPLPNVVPWRDHWMQAIYYIPKPLHFSAPGVEFTLNCNHDEYSLWFDVFSAESGSLATVSVPRHTCTCSLHMTYGRSRIGQINQSLRNKRFLRCLEETIGEQSHVLVLGDGCILGLATAKLGAASVLCHEPHRYSRRFVQSLAARNKLTNVQFVEQLEALEPGQIAKLTNIFAEPYFLTSILPWDNFYFGTLLLKIRDKLGPKVAVVPQSGRIFAVPVQFLDLHKIRSPVGTCEGFDLSLFDEMVKVSATAAQTKVEAQPLWEYPCRALAEPQLLLHVSFLSFDADVATEGVIPISFSGSCNGIALWVDWSIDNSNHPKSTVSTGPTEPIVAGEFIKWDMFVRQGVQLIGNAQEVKPGSNVRWTTKFKPLEGRIQFSFDVQLTSE